MDQIAPLGEDQASCHLLRRRARTDLREQHAVQLIQVLRATEHTRQSIIHKTCSAHTTCHRRKQCARDVTSAGHARAKAPSAFAPAIRILALASLASPSSTGRPRAADDEDRSDGEASSGSACATPRFFVAGPSLAAVCGDDGPAAAALPRFRLPRPAPVAGGSSTSTSCFRGRPRRPLAGAEPVEEESPDDDEPAAVG
jgi:hypothetical protein